MANHRCKSQTYRTSQKLLTAIAQGVGGSVIKNNFLKVFEDFAKVLIFMKIFD
jgi:hypothetical protein